VTAVVRPGTDADRAFVKALAQGTVIDSVAAFRQAPAPIVRGALERLLEIVASQSHVTLIAEIDGERAGFLLMLDELPDEVTGQEQGFIAYMAVEPAHRRAGAGAALLAAAEDEATRRRLPYITLMVTEDNLAARALYDSRGYFTERRLMCKTL
jgi:ribosomal protein S18 acetylase RimI-like enzyme